MNQISRFMTGRAGGGDLRCEKLPKTNNRRLSVGDVGDGVRRIPRSGGKKARSHGNRLTKVESWEELYLDNIYINTHRNTKAPSSAVGPDRLLSHMSARRHEARSPRRRVSAIGGSHNPEIQTTIPLCFLLAAGVGSAVVCELFSLGRLRWAMIIPSCAASVLRLWAPSCTFLLFFA